MISLSDRVTVPQIFFNDVHIGGADDTFEAIKDWDWNRYVSEVESKPDPKDERLVVPVEDPSTAAGAALEEEEEATRQRRRKAEMIAVPTATNTTTTGDNDGENATKTAVSVLEITESLKKNLASKRLSKNVQQSLQEHVYGETSGTRGNEILQSTNTSGGGFLYNVAKQTHY